MMDKTTTTAAAVLTRATGWGDLEAGKYLAALTEEDRAAIAALDGKPDFGPDLRAILDAVADRRLSKPKPTGEKPRPPADTKRKGDK